MSAEILRYGSIPLGSLIARSKSDEDYYLGLLLDMPKQLFETISSARTGAFLRGIINNYQLPKDQVLLLSFSVLQVLVGEKTLAQFPSLLSGELQMANDKAQGIAQEIERELVAPISLTLNQYIGQKKRMNTSVGGQLRSSPPTSSGLPANVLDLKTQPRPPLPPPIPR